VLKASRPGFDSLAESGQKTLKVGIHSMGGGSGGQGGAVASWLFIDDTDKVEGGLMLLFFSLVFPLPSLEFFLPTPLIHSFSCLTFNIKNG